MAPYPDFLLGVWIVPKQLLFKQFSGPFELRIILCKSDFTLWSFTSFLRRCRKSQISIFSFLIYFDSSSILLFTADADSVVERLTLLDLIWLLISCLLLSAFGISQNLYLLRTPICNLWYTYIWWLVYIPLLSTFEVSS